MGLAQVSPDTVAASHASPSPSDQHDINEKVRASGTSFYWAMRLLPKDRREALFAVYAFCREVDDIADGESSQADKLIELEKWRKRIDLVSEGIEGDSEDALTRALAAACTKYGLKREDFLAVIDGMEMDAKGPIIAPLNAELDRYCDCVASAVGRLCVPIFGEPTDAGRKVADHLGRALQLTNILRDVSEDAKVGRLYLPADALNTAGLGTRVPTEVANDPRLPEVMKIVGKQAENEYANSEHALEDCSKDAMRPAVIMMMVYRKYLERIRANGWRPLPPRTKLGNVKAKLEKLLIALRYGVF